MRSTASLPIMALIVAASLTGCSASAQARSGSEQLAAAAQSFSDIPFGASEAPAGLTAIDNERCRQWGECVYRNAEGVEHYFWDDELVVKSVKAGERPIAALGIGGLRSMENVLIQVRQFLPEARIDCREMPDAPEPFKSCGATLGEGWITLTFDDAQRLIDVKIDAYHFT